MKSEVTEGEKDNTKQRIQEVVDLMEEQKDDSVENNNNNNEEMQKDNLLASDSNEEIQKEQNNYQEKQEDLSDCLGRCIWQNELNYVDSTAQSCYTMTIRAVL